MKILSIVKGEVNGKDGFIATLTDPVQRTNQQFAFSKEEDITKLLRNL